MTTLAKQVLKVLNDNYLYLNSDLITLEDVADYIDMMNEGNAEYYSPEQWLRDTKINFPEYLMTKEEVNRRYYEPILCYLATQRELCIDQTGMEPVFEDYEGEMDCEDYNNMLREHELDVDSCSVKIIDLFNYLLDYWNKN